MKNICPFLEFAVKRRVLLNVIVPACMSSVLQNQWSLVNKSCHSRFQSVQKAAIASTGFLVCLFLTVLQLPLAQQCLQMDFVLSFNWRSELTITFQSPIILLANILSCLFSSKKFQTHKKQPKILHWVPQNWKTQLHVSVNADSGLTEASFCVNFLALC